MGLRQGFKRAGISVDAEKWDRLQEKLKSGGYPPGGMSYFIDYCLDELESYLDGEPVQAWLPLYQLEVCKQGVKGASQHFATVQIEKG